MSDVWGDMSPVADPGLAELDALLAAMETAPEGMGRNLLIPVTPQVIRWLLRGRFSATDGHHAVLAGGSIRGDLFTPIFRDAALAAPADDEAGT